MGDRQTRRCVGGVRRTIGLGGRDRGHIWQDLGRTIPINKAAAGQSGLIVNLARVNLGLG